MTARDIRERDRPSQPRPVSGRVPPHDLDAEAAVISACLLAGEAVDEVQPLVSAEDCYSDANGRILLVIFEVHASGQPADLVTVANRLRAREQLQMVGGASYLAQLVDATPAHENVGAHARIVRHKARQRRMIGALQKLAAEGYFDPPGDWMDTCLAEVEAVLQVDRAREGVWMGEAVQTAMANVQASLARGGLLGWSTGLRGVDRMLGGLLPAMVTVVGGRPGMGKTSFALGIAEAIAEQTRDGERLGACMFSLEMKRDELARRQTFTRAMVDSSPLKRGQDIGVEAWGRLDVAARQLSALPFWIDDTEALSPAAIRSRARRVRADMRKRGVRLAVIVVDYIQLMDGRPGLSKGSNREQEVAQCSKKLKELSKELDVHVIAIAQLNREAEKRGGKDKRPRMSDLRESGAVEQDADNILMIYRDEFYNPESEAKGIAEILVEKQRAGIVGVVPVRFSAWCTRFEDLRGDGWSDEEPGPLPRDPEPYYEHDPRQGPDA